MLAVVMAGGKGTRLRPLTCEKPKPMVPVANRPLLEHVLRLLARGGWSQVALTLCYQPEKIQAYFGDGRQLGVNLHYFVEDKPLGTAGSVKLASGLFDGGTVLVASGDALADFDLGPALAFHRDRGALVTVILTKVESPLEYGVVITAPDGRIGRFLEKPGWGEVFSDTVNTGFYLIEPEVFARVPPGRAFDFSRDLFPALMGSGERLYGYVTPGYWSDIGLLEQYRQAHHDLLAGLVSLPPTGREVRPGVWAGEGTEIDPGAFVESPCLIGDFCRIERGASVGPYCVLGDHTLLAEGVSLKRSILWRHVYVGRDAEVRGAIIGDRTVLRNKVSIFEGAVVSDDCLIGAHATIRPRAKLWPGKNVASGSMIRDSLIWGERSLRGLFGAVGVAGVANREITPEFAVRLGAAFAGFIGSGRAVAVASDGSAVTRMLKRAATAGILGAGVGAGDLGTTTAPAVRFAVGALGLAGGMYLRLSGRDRHEAVVQFLDPRGLPLDRQAERAMEQAFITEDFPRAEAGRVGELSYAPGLSEMYLDGIGQLVDGEAIKDSGLTVAVGASAGPACTLLPGLLDRLGCRYMRIEVPEPHLQAGECGAVRAAAGVWEFQGDLAVFVDSAGEELTILAPGGRLLDKARLATLLSLAELRRGKVRRIPLPVTASEAVDDLARVYQGQIVRTKAQRRSVLEEFAAMSPAVRGLLLPAFDALVSLAVLLELLSTEKRGLAAILDELPAYHRVERAVACTWETKGRLMRRLFEDNRDRPLDLTDGLRIREETGWTLILPDGDEPLIRIYSEAGTPEEADALGRWYAAKIAELSRETTSIGRDARARTP